MTNLKPCPFCGSPAKESFDEGRNQEWWIVCSNDDCDIFPTSACRVQEDARAWWNKRAAAPEGERSKEHEQRAAAIFLAYFVHNYPPRTIIADPAWHAPKIFRAVLYALRDGTPPTMNEGGKS